MAGYRTYRGTMGWTITPGQLQYMQYCGCLYSLLKGLYTNVYHGVYKYTFGREQDALSSTEPTSLFEHLSSAATSSGYGPYALTLSHITKNYCS